MKNKQKSLEILVVEDDEKHLSDAQAEINKRIASGVAINATYVTNYQEAKKQMSERKFDGIISDIFFPSGMEKDESLRQEAYALLAGSIERQIEGNVRDIEETNFSYTRESQIREQKRIREDCLAKLREVTSEWMEGNSLAPYGALIAQIATKMKIPTVLCTSGHHHGAKYSPVVNAVIGTFKVSVIDRIITDQDDYMNFEKESQKNWPEAVDKVLGLIPDALYQ